MLFSLFCTKVLQHTDYTVTVTKDGKNVTEMKNVGEYTITVTGMGDYADSDEVTKTYTIKAKSLKDDSVTVSLDETSYEYVGTAIEPEFTVYDGEKQST